MAKLSCQETLQQWEPTALAKRLFCNGCGAQIAMDYSTLACCGVISGGQWGQLVG